MQATLSFSTVTPFNPFNISHLSIYNQNLIATYRHLKVPARRRQIPVPPATRTEDVSRTSEKLKEDVASGLDPIRGTTSGDTESWIRGKLGRCREGQREAL